MKTALALLFLAAPLCAADWPLFRGDARMTGTADAKLPDQLAELWAFDCGGPVESAAAIVGDRVYVASLDKHLYSLDFATGKQVWKTPLGAMQAPPSVHGDRVYVGDLEGKFYAVNRLTGEKLWAFDTGAEVHAGANFVGDDILIGSHSASLFRLSPDGKKVWEFKTDGPVNGTAAIVGERTFVAGCDEKLHVLNTKTGESLGSVELGGQAAATAAVEGDFAYVGLMTNQVVAVNWKALKKGWEFAPKRRQQPFFASPAVAGDIVVAGARDKKVYALDRTSGKELWNFATEGNVDASPVVVAGRVYVGCLSSLGEFYVLDLATGKQLQQLTLGSSVGGSAAVSGDALVVGTDKGKVYKLGAKK